MKTFKTLLVLVTLLISQVMVSQAQNEVKANDVASFRTPDQGIYFVKSLRVPYKASQMLPSKELKAYPKAAQQALMLGAYRTDLTYAAYFRKKELAGKINQKIEAILKLWKEKKYFQDVSFMELDAANEPRNMVFVTLNMNYEKLIKGLFAQKKDRLAMLVISGWYTQEMYYIFKNMKEYPDLTQVISVKRESTDQLAKFHRVYQKNKKLKGWAKPLNQLSKLLKTEGDAKMQSKTLKIVESLRKKFVK